MISNMQCFTGWEYLMIDVANSFGLDKQVYSDRIKWAEAHLDELENLADQADSKPLYIKAVQAVRKAQHGELTGHLVGFDAVCSGMQIMSALTGCRAGAEATGLINTNERPDAYTKGTAIMSGLLGSSVTVDRKDIKKAIMTVLYGSTRQPKEVFGDGTEEYRAFYEMLGILCPGAVQLLRDLQASWDSTTLAHEWKLPDGFDAHVRVFDETNTRIAVDELGGASFTFQFKENKPMDKGLSNAANVVHSVDAYLLRSLIRRCSYKPNQINRVKDVLITRLNFQAETQTTDNSMVNYLRSQYERSGVPDIRILSFIDNYSVFSLSVEHCKKLLGIVEMMRAHKPFSIVTVHDDFKCHPNNMNWLRMHYREILAEISESKLIDDLLSQLYKQQGTFQRMSTNLVDEIRKSDYAIC